MSQKVKASHVSLVTVGTCIGFLFWATLARQLPYISENKIFNITGVTSPQDLAIFCRTPAVKIVMDLDGGFMGSAFGK
jgi:hypothetical protein